MPASFIRFLIAGLLLTPVGAIAATNKVAAVVLRTADAELRFADGSVADVRFRRLGMEYFERVADGVFMGFTVGYSENDSADAARPMATVGGVYGSLGLRFEAPLTATLALQGRAEYLLQRDREAAAEFETRAWETRAEFGPRWRYRRLELAAGASWRDVDYRATVQDANGETVRRAEAVDAWSAFAAVGVTTDNDGRIALRYDAGGEDAWALNFSKSF